MLHHVIKNFVSISIFCHHPLTVQLQSFFSGNIKSVALLPSYCTVHLVFSVSYSAKFSIMGKNGYIDVGGVVIVIKKVDLNSSPCI